MAFVEWFARKRSHETLLQKFIFMPSKSRKASSKFHMASEIMFDPPPILKSDMPESSMERELQGITIPKAQRDSQELRKEDTPPTLVLPPFLLEDEENFQACLSSGNCTGLLKMVNDFHPKLFLEKIDEKYLRSALHMAVLEGSTDLICALMKKLSGGDNLKLDEFLEKQDNVGLSALHMAALIAHKGMISCISKQGLQVPDSLESKNPYFQSPTSEDEKPKLFEELSLLFDKPDPISSDQRIGQLSLQEWFRKNKKDFVFCLFETERNWGPCKMEASEFGKAIKYIFDNGDPSFLKRLFKVQNDLGKTLLHAHIDNSNFETLYQNLATCFPAFDWNVVDFCGRTPLHWAAAQGKVEVVTFLAKQAKIKLNARYIASLEENMKTSTNFNIDGIRNVAPLHLAVIHNHVGVVEALLKVEKKQGLNVNAMCCRQYKDLNGTPMSTNWTPIQLAAYMGQIRILRKFLQDDRTYDPGLMNGSKRPKTHNMIPALHLAASQFYPKAMKTLVDCKRMDTLIKDENGNIALHYATEHAHRELQNHTNLYDYVTMSHFTSKPPKSRMPTSDDVITCIDILMQSGLRMGSRNNIEKTPNMHKESDAKVKTWWLGKMAKEYQEIKNNLISAANAVSVTAALVATASFVGPLQPPLGLLDDGNQTWLDGYSKVQHTSVQVFLFCDSLSFYLAIAAIVFAMLPSWPLPHEGLVQEVSIAQRCVQGSVLLLFGSIIFVVCAFSAASIAIVPNQQWRYMINAVISMSLGILICFLILFLSFIRLLALFSSKNTVAKKVSNVATRILLWEPSTSSTK